MPERIRQEWRAEDKDKERTDEPEGGQVRVSGKRRNAESRKPVREGKWDIATPWSPREFVGRQNQWQSQEDEEHTPCEIGDKQGFDTFLCLAPPPPTLVDVSGEKISGREEEERNANGTDAVRGKGPLPPNNGFRRANRQGVKGDHQTGTDETHVG